MLRNVCVVFLFACSAASVSAQEDFSRLEVFGGYSHLRADYRNDAFLITDDHEGLHGFHAQVVGNFNRYLGLAGDISGHYKSFDVENFGGIPEVRFVSARTSLHSFLGGPQAKLRGRQVTLFGHALFGAARRSTSIVSEDVIPGNNLGRNFTEAETKFAFALGGGVDINVSRRIAIRAVQADYLRTRFARESQNNFRVSIGVVFK